MMLVRACLVAGSASAAIAGWEAARGVAEWRRLELVLLDLTPSGRISSRQDLVAIKNFLAERISFDVDRRHEKRPLLREPASVILETAHGFCGENARVAILLLALGGVPANRLYLTGTAWNHVAVEHRWDGHWFLFDGHADPCTVLPDEAVASIPSNSVQLFPNGHRPHNSWIDVHRIHSCIASRPPIPVISGCQDHSQSCMKAHPSCAPPPTASRAAHSSPSAAGAVPPYDHRALRAVVPPVWSRCSSTVAVLPGRGRRRQVFGLRPDLRFLPPARAIRVVPGGDRSWRPVQSSPWPRLVGVDLEIEAPLLLDVPRRTARRTLDLAGRAEQKLTRRNHLSSSLFACGRTPGRPPQT